MSQINNNCADIDDDLVIIESDDYRGTITTKDGKIIAKTFPVAEEYVECEITLALVAEYFSKSLLITDAHEGTILRVYFHNGKWRVSTFRRVDASKSRWGSKKTFGELFQEAISMHYKMNADFRHTIDYGKWNEPTDDPNEIYTRFTSYLDERYVHVFILKRRFEDRIVCRSPPFPTFLHIGTYVEPDVLSFTRIDGFPYANIISKENADANALVAYIRAIDPYEIQGVICFLPDNKQVKIMNSEYYKLFELRGNQPNLLYRYLELRNTPSVESFIQLYKERAVTFETINQHIKILCDKLFNMYMKRFIKKESIPMLLEAEYRVLRECHAWHVSNRTTNKVTFGRVTDAVTWLPAQIIYHILRKTYPVMYT